MSYTRFAIYYFPPEGPLATFGRNWLGWDIARGGEVPQFDLPGLPSITAAPRKYGFHGTLKPPFRLSDGQSLTALEDTVAELAATTAAATCDTLELKAIGRFLALTPKGGNEDLRRLAAACVRDLDIFRKPPAPDDLERRRKVGLTDRQEALLTQWGYPYVMEEFRFHLTLTGPLSEGSAELWIERAERVLPALPNPFVVDQIALCGERADGRFEVIHRYTLAG
ncbi:hypothetical protein PARPLA_00922 [Rhodobacteraceae bacterium THAF1]|uniref:DUF1045 domain-containing protein n=1 Tax=Palleronia sp. THAF1 TaxID=2587842 RepID=UPI000F415F1B|nr:DUF1045 domain-containing protein [Palleronia sp. THAF1]QFU09552.1 hypothetical protein FIU81_12805 [Palleronia sp. THAF1]VDC20083.1 hypothetical protein PARPLA_00922 [Rhodobacteraceae bacterium THAF1]